MPFSWPAVWPSLDRPEPRLEPPIAMAADPTPMEPVGLVQVAWPVSQEALADTFGQPIQARRPIQVTPVSRGAWPW